MPAPEEDRIVQLLREVATSFLELGYDFGQLYGLGRTDADALIVVTEAAAAGSPIGNTGLARRLRISTASATVLVDRLTAAGMLMRERHASDGRRVVLRPTKDAQAAGSTHFGRLNAELTALVQALDEPGRTAVAGFLTGAVEVARRR